VDVHREAARHTGAADCKAVNPRPRMRAALPGAGDLPMRHALCGIGLDAFDQGMHGIGVDAVDDAARRQGRNILHFDGCGHDLDPFMRSGLRSVQAASNVRTGAREAIASWIRPSCASVVRLANVLAKWGCCAPERMYWKRYASSIVCCIMRASGALSCRP